jgi:hypothetical protein
MKLLETHEKQKLGERNAEIGHSNNNSRDRGRERE